MKWPLSKRGRSCCRPSDGPGRMRRFAAVGLAMALAGCGHKTSSNAASASAKVEATKPDPGYRCLDLPGAARVDLASSPDHKTLYYVQYRDDVVSGQSWRKSTRARYDLYSVPANGGVPSQLAQDVAKNIAAAPGDRVVFKRITKDDEFEFERTYGLFVVQKDGKETRLSPPDAAGEDAKSKFKVNNFAVDAAGSRVFFTGGSDFQLALYAAPLDGGDPKKVQDHVNIVWGPTPDGKSLLVRDSIGTETVPIGGGTMKRIGEVSYGLVSDGTTSYFVPKSGGGIKNIVGDTIAELKWSVKDDRLIGLGPGGALVERDGGADPPVPHQLFAGDASDGKQWADIGSDSATASAPLDAGAVAVLLEHEMSDDHAEADICVLSRAGITVPSRTVRKSQLALYDKLQPLAEGDLAGARIFIHPTSGGVDQDSPFVTATFVVETAGPDAPPQLQDRAKKLQADAVAATTNAKLGVSITFKKNKRVGRAVYHPAVPDSLLVTGGDQSHTLAVEDGFPVELDPKVTFTSEPGEKSGSYSCSGTIKNRTSAPITLKVRCTVHNVTLGDESQEAAPAPATIPPGQTAKYDFLAGGGQEDDATSTSLLKDDKDFPYLNLYIQRAARGIDQK